MPDKTPNILFLFPDQWRWDWLGCAGHGIPVRTPNIDALAARGTRFTQCRTNSPVCAPARACLALGTRYEHCGVPSNGFNTDPERTTVFQLLRAAGYRVATTGKNDLHKATHWKGLDGWTQLLGRYGFTEAREHSGKLDAVNNGTKSPICYYTSLLHANGLMGALSADFSRRLQDASYATDSEVGVLPRQFYTDDVAGRNAVELIEQFPQEGPWMMWVNFPGPHDPMDPPQELRERYDGVEFPEAVDPEPVHQGKPVHHQQLRRNYAAECEGIDDWVGWILDAVERRGELDNTVVIFCSDHGEMLGDHGRYTKGCGYEGSVHVPLIIAGPKIPAGAVNDELVELMDLSSTMLDFAELQTPGEWESRSLKPLLDGSGVSRQHRDYQFSALGSWRMVFDGRWKLILDEQQEPMLFDLKADPEERFNLAEQETAVRQRLTKVLDERRN